MERKSQSNVADELVVSRTFKAPRKLVFQLFTDAEHFAQWWGPAGFTMRVAKLDLRPGGMCLYQIESPQGMSMWGRFVYEEITPPGKIVFISSFSDENGGITAAPMLADWPLEIRNIATLTEESGKTTITLRGGPVNATPEQMKVFRDNRAGMNEGFSGAFNKLEEYLAKIQH